MAVAVLGEELCMRGVHYTWVRVEYQGNPHGTQVRLNVLYDMLISKAKRKSGIDCVSISIASTQLHEGKNNPRLAIYV